MDVPYGYCQCGCGEKTRIVRGAPRRFINTHNARVRADPPMSNPIRYTDDYAELGLTSRGTFVWTKIDSEDVGPVASLNRTWSLSTTFPERPYVWQQKTGVLLHRFLTNCPLDQVVDHMNHDTLDNRKSNLRIVTQRLNTFNRARLNSSNTSGYRGVSFNRRSGQWTAKVRRAGTILLEKLFPTAEEADLAVQACLRDNKLLP